MDQTKAIRISSLTTALLFALAGATSALALTIPSLIFGFLLVVAFIAFVACLTLRSDQRTWYGLAGVGFTLIYGVFISFNYYTQLSLLLRGTAIPAWLDMTNFDSLFMVIEMLGYFFMGLATLALIPFFANNNLGKAIKVLFFANALLGVGGLVGYALQWPMSLLFGGLILWNVMMPIAAVLVFFYFKASSVAMSQDSGLS